MARTRASLDGDAPAFTYLQDGEVATHCVTFAELDRRARAVAVALQRAGLQGERALMLYSSSLDFVVAFFGCVYAGVIAVPAYPPKANQSFARLHGMVVDAAPHYALTTASLIANLHRRAEQTAHFPALEWIATDGVTEDPDQWVPPDVAPDDLAFLQYTSGSTGDARGVMVSHASLMHNLEGLRLRWAMDRSSVMVTWLPTFHDLGLVFGVLESVYAATHCVMMSPTAFVQRPLRWLQAITRYRGTHSLAPNFAYELAIAKMSVAERETLDLRSWTMALNAAEPVRATTLLRFGELFAPHGFDPVAFCPAYGLAEGTLHASGLPMGVAPDVAWLDAAELAANQVVLAEPGPPAVAVVACGPPAPGVRVAIVDPETTVECAGDEVGEIWLAGDSVARGYWRRPELSADTFAARSAAGDGPFLRTGDLGFMREGQLSITGRIKDLVIVRGQNHYPQDIEVTAEQSHPALRTSCSAAFSIAAPDERLVIVAEVERTALRALNADDVVGRIRQSVAEDHDLQVHAVVLVKPATIPKTSSGKIQRRACRTAFLDRTLDVVAEWRMPLPPQTASALAPRPADVAALRAWLVARIATAAGVTETDIELSAPLARYGFDSVAAVTLAADLEQWLGESIPAGFAYDHPTIAAMVRALVDDSQAPAAIDAPAGDPGDGIAVIAVACRFPQAASPEAFWALLHDGGDAIVDLPESRARLEAGADGLSAQDDVRLRRGAFLEGIDGFDPAFFGVSPRETISMDPQQRLLLEVAWEALERAGIAPAAVARSRTGVFVGISSNDYARVQQRAGGGTDAWSGTGNALSIAANRLSYLLDVRGPSVAIDTACSSSLVAVHMACQSLRLGESELAFAGGVNLILSPEWSQIFSEAQMLAADGRCKTFDAAADGYVRGEGCGVVLLKPLARARADGDRILAVIRGSAVNQDGRSNGLTAPNGPAQQDVIRRALTQAAVAPQEISYVEAHGTGTPLGDPIELEALTAVLGSGRTTAHRLRVGSVKTNIGHLEAAAGIAGLIKVVLGLQHRQIPPHLHFVTPNPYFKWAQAGIDVPTTPQAWGNPDRSVYAGVSGFGFGGTNAHVILEGPPVSHPASAAADEGRGLLVLSARTLTALRTLAAQWANALAGAEPRDGSDEAGPCVESDWRSICATAAQGRAHWEWRAAICADSSAEAASKLGAIAADASATGVWRGEARPRLHEQVAMIFPGQGAQWWGMGRELYDASPVYRDALDRCAAVLDPLLSVPLVEVLYGARGESLLERTEFAQPACFAVAYALLRVWESLGVRPAAVAGHSVGEFAAAVAAGVLDPESACRLLAVRGRLMQPLDGRMAVLLAPPSQVRELIAAMPAVTIAAINGATQVVIAGPDEGVGLALVAAASAGIHGRLLPGAQAFHTALMEPMLPAWRAEVDRAAPATPAEAPAGAAACTWVSTVTGREIDVVSGAYWVDQVRQPVQYADAVARLWALGCRAFIEVGPTAGLTTLASEAADTTSDGVWAVGLRRGRSAWVAMRDAVAQLHTAGVSIDWRAWEPAPYTRALLPTYPFERQAYWVEATGPRSGRPSVDHAFELQWEEVPPVGEIAQAAGPATVWVVCGGRQAETMAAVAAGLRMRGAIVAEPASTPEALVEALEWASARGLAGVVHVGGLDAPYADAALDPQAVQRAAVDGCMSVAAVVRALQTMMPPPAARLWIVTRGAVAVRDFEFDVAVVQAPLWGLGRAIALEHPDLWGGLCDLDPESPTPVADLIACLALTPLEDQLAVRAGRTYAVRIAPCRLDRDPPLAVNGNATYLITGGTGSLGLKIAGRLVADGARSIALLSRRGLTDNRAARSAIADMERAGAAVTVFTADVAEEQDLAAVIEAIDTLLPPLRGIVHAAGVTDDGVLLRLTRDRFERVIRPKVAGAWNLHRATAGIELDFFILVSSVAAVAGSAGQANYGAANAFLDALAVCRSRIGLPALAINWGVWADSGLGAALDAVHEQRLASWGFRSLLEDEALRAFERLLGRHGQVVVVRADWRRYAAAHPRSSIVRAYATPPSESGATVRFIDTLRAAAAGERHDLVATFTAGQVSAVLRCEPGRVLPQRGFFEQGMDSLLALELQRRVEAAFGFSLPATAVFDHPTVDSLAAYLLERAGPVSPVTLGGAVAAAPGPTPVPAIVDEIRKLTPRELEALIDDELGSLLP